MLNTLQKNSMPNLMPLVIVVLFGYIRMRYTSHVSAEVLLRDDVKQDIMQILFSIVMYLMLVNI